MRLNRVHVILGRGCVCGVVGLEFFRRLPALVPFFVVVS